MPENDVHDRFVRYACQRLEGDERSARLFGRLVKMGGIEHRYSVLPAEGPDSADAIFLPGAFPTTAARMRLFERYAPLPVFGEAASSAVAVDRGGAIAVATRLPVGLAESGGWRDTVLHLSGGDRIDVLTGRRHSGSRLRLADVLSTYPVALLIPAPDDSSTPDSEV